MAFQPWTTPMFKQDQPSRVEVRAARAATEAARRRQWDKAIDARDSRQCRACGRHSDPERVGLLERGHRAHIVYASAGGSWEPCNRVTLCARCHSDEHKDRLRFTPEGGPYVGLDANQGLEFWRQDEHGAWFLSKRELSPHRVEKD